MPQDIPQLDVIPLPQAINKYFELSIYLLVLVGFGTLASTGGLDLPAILLVGADEKRLHTFEELRHASEGWLSATSENMTIHIDMTARKTAPFPPDIRARIQAVTDAHAAIPRPEGLGRRVGMPAKG